MHTSAQWPHFKNRSHAKIETKGFSRRSRKSAKLVSCRSLAGVANLAMGGGDDMPPAATKKERVDQLKQEVEHINAQISSLVGRKAQLTAELGTLGYGGL